MLSKHAKYYIDIKPVNKQTLETVEFLSTIKLFFVKVL